MIISKTPLRISLFGGGTDFPEFFEKKKVSILGGTINKYIYISLINQKLITKKNKIKLFYRLKEEVDNVSQIKHKVIKEAFKKFKLKDSIELHISSEIPSYTGLGSSSSFTVGLFNLLQNIKKIKTNKYKLAEDTINFERNILKEFVGYQDQIHAVFGGFNLIEIFKNKIKVKKILNQRNLKNFERNLFLVFTGITRRANNIKKKKIKKIDKNYSNLEKINIISNKAKSLFKQKKINFNKIGLLLDQTWKLKKKLSKNVSNSKIDKIYELAKKNGAIGGKLLGAGSGGFLLFYVKNENLKNFKNSMKPYQVIDFKFTLSGSKVYKI